ESMDLRVEVVGPLAEVTVFQRFRNDGSVPADATYVFPLQEDAVVDRMRMRVGDRVIEATLQGREQAQATYDTAVERGDTAALTVQETADVFTQHVGNIPPGEAVQVELSVVQPVPRVDGAYDLVLPLALPPRFIPSGVPTADWMFAEPPDEDVLATVRVRGTAGLDVERIWSPSHPDLAVLGERDWVFAYGVARLARDLHVAWETPGDDMSAVLFYDGEHGMLVLQPPDALVGTGSTPREVVFVLDTSASMAGEAWDRGRAVLDGAIAGLSPEDTFQVVAGRALQPAPVSATPEEKTRARQAVNLLSPHGPADITVGLQRALTLPASPERPRTVVVLSDGRQEMDRRAMRVLEERRNGAIVHAVALSTSPGRGVLAQLARLGGGVFLVPRPDETGWETAERLGGLLGPPVLTEIEVGTSMELVDPTLPDLVPGHPLIRLGRTTEVLYGWVLGACGQVDCVVPVRTVGVDRGRALASSWARARIRELLDEEVRTPGFDAADIGYPIAMEYGVVSPWTSYVAVDPGARIEIERIEPTARGQVLSPDFLQKVPSGRSYQSATQMAAGVTPGSGANPNMGGAAANERAFLLDGSNVTDPVSGVFQHNFQPESSRPPEATSTPVWPEVAATPAGGSPRPTVTAYGRTGEGAGVATLEG
ncbi:MAG: VWA domain-containing protein, partial [Myxococcales bacterium]|nr:VWA domain-containing protein [Myxococcales bacterium]